MNSGKTFRSHGDNSAGNAGGDCARAAAKLSGIACLRDTLTWPITGRFATASFLDCGLPSTVDAGDLAPGGRKQSSRRLNESAPDLIGD